MMSLSVDIMTVVERILNSRTLTGDFSMITAYSPTALVTCKHLNHEIKVVSPP